LTVISYVLFNNVLRDLSYIYLYILVYKSHLFM